MTPYFVLKNCIFIFLFLLGGALTARSEEANASIKVDFRIGESVIDPTFSDNARQMESFAEAVRVLGGTEKKNTIYNPLRLTLLGGASPDGTYETNTRLANERQRAIEKYLHSKVDIADSIIVRTGDYIDWEWLKAAVAASNLKDKFKILDILNEPERIVGYFGDYTVDSRVPKLQKLSGGKPWSYMKENIFPQMRFASASIEIAEDIFLEPTPEPIPEVEPEPIEVPDLTVQYAEPEPEPEPEPVVEPVVTDTVPDCLRYKHFYLKTNALRWLLAQTNIGVEYDLAEHWSVEMQAAYSGWNYFRSTLKFRTTDLKPGIRYWLSCRNEGWFFGAHFGMTWYNYAFEGKYRIQDHKKRTPALGGGIDVGYRMPLSKDGRWNVDFALSAGVYHLHYDKYLNERNGRLVGEDRKTYFGLDNAAVTFSYRFDVRGKGGDK